MKRLCFTVLLLSFALLIPPDSPVDAGSAPWRCGTKLTPEDVAAFQAREQAMLSQPQKVTLPPGTCIPIAAHIIRKSDGTGGLSIERLNQGVTDCNVAYVNTGMTFHLLANIDYIDNDDYYYNIDTDAEIDAMIQENVVANAINVYFTPNLSNEDGGLCGRGSFTTSTPQGVAMNNGCTGTSDNPSTFPHELGHFFDLFHTHETAFGAELVDGSNCNSAGDKLCDTPADPGLDEGDNIDASCNYYGSETDGNGDSYSPDTHQMMSYAPKLCRDTFSPLSELKVGVTLILSRSELLTIGCPPVADAGADITAECASYTTTDVQLDGTGSSDPDGDTITYAWSAPSISFDDATLAQPTGGFPEGTTTVQLIVNDGAYNDTSHVDVTVEDTTDPTFTYCPVDTTLECSDFCGTPADSIASWFAGVAATDVCDATVGIMNDAPECFPKGETLVTFTAVDDAGNDATCTATITVVDTTPPVIDVVMDRDVLWPPNHKLVECCADVTVTDVCCEAPTFVLYSITSDEPDNDKGDGNTINDIQDAGYNTDDVCFSLRSERQGGGDGRTYTIIYQAMDCSENVAYDTVTVDVPHDQSASAFSSSGFVPEGTALVSNTSNFALVIPGSSSLDVSSIDAERIYAGNTAGSVRAYTTRTLDIDRDGDMDLAAIFQATAQMMNAMLETYDAATISLGDGTMDATTATDGPIGLHFVTASGSSYLVSNIYALGAPLLLPENRGKEIRDPEVLNRAPLVTSNARTTGISSISPNPFNPQTTVHFSLATSARVRIAIYNVTGALVRNLVDETMPAGDHQARWDGVTDAGHGATSGIYFVRMTAGAHTEVRKIVMLK